MMRALSKTFIQGLITIFPIALPMYVVWWLGSAAEEGLGKLLQLALPEHLYVPGMGLFLGLLVVMLVGFVMRAWFFRRLLVLVERLVHRIPLLGMLYGSVKDLMAFTGGQKKRGIQAVTVSIDGTQLRLMGLLTRESAIDVTASEQDRDCAAVYLPLSYALGGLLVVAPRASVTPLAMSAEDALRTVITAGMSVEGQSDKSAAAIAR